MVLAIGIRYSSKNLKIETLEVETLSLKNIILFKKFPMSFARMPHYQTLCKESILERQSFFPLKVGRKIFLFHI